MIVGDALYRPCALDPNSEACRQYQVNAAPPVVQADPQSSSNPVVGTFMRRNDLLFYGGIGVALLGLVFLIARR